MSHANARLTFHTRCTLVQRILSGRPVAHVAKEMGVSRQCARRPAAVHQAALPLAEREGREAQPDPAGRVGLPTALRQQRPAHRRTGNMARLLQQ